MIGGTDIILENLGLDAGEALDLVARIASRQWGQAVFVDAQSGRRFDSFASAAFGSLSELFVFRDENARQAWERDGLEAGHADTMVYAIAGDEQLTLVIADPDAATLRTVIAELKDSLAFGTPRSTWQSRRSAA